MDWPVDTRSEKPAVKWGKRTRKLIDLNRIPGYPRIDDSSVNFATLGKSGRRYEWISLVNNPSDQRLSPVNNPVKLWQGARRAERRPPYHSARKTAKNQANFIREHYLEIDIQHEFLRDEILEEIAVSKAHARFDTYAGDLIYPLYHTLDSKPTTAIAFASGETYSDLRILQTIDELQPGMESEPEWSFMTPIRQITASPFDIGQDAIYMGIRTMGGTSLFRAALSGSPCRLEQLVSLTRDDINGRPAVDMKIRGSTLDAIINNDCGDFFLYQLDQTGGKIAVAKGAVDDPEENVEGLWRVALTGADETCLLSSNKSVNLVDFRGGLSALKLYTSQPGEVVTSIEDTHSDNITRFITTTDTVWVDTRSPGRPLFSWKHRLAPHLSLSTHTESLGNGCLTFTSTMMNGMVLVYNTSNTLSDWLCRFNDQPYSIRSPLGIHTKHDGITFAKHPLADQSTIDIIQLSQSGSLYTETLGFQTRDETPSYLPAEDVVPYEYLARDVPLVMRNSASIDMSPILSHLLNHHEYDDKDEASASTEEALRKMEEFTWWNDGPAGTVLTALDVVVKSGEAPHSKSRADFLATTPLQYHDSTTRERISHINLQQRAPWHFNLARTMTSLGHSGHVQDVPPHSEAARCVDEVKFDLSLSEDIFSTRPLRLQPKGDGMVTMCMATEALSIKDEPPPISFGFLQPSKKKEASVEGTSVEDEEQLVPLGVRLLLQDWDIGSDPNAYAFTNPYDTAPDIQDPISTMPNSPPGPRQLHTEPPAITAPRINIVQPVHRTLTQSQDVVYPASQEINPRIGNVSQELFASTQVLPGPFGGRPVAKKKAKRVGGF